MMANEDFTNQNRRNDESNYMQKGQGGDDDPNDTYA